MTTELHRRLMALALELRRGGNEDLAKWIQKWIAHEQRESKKRPQRREALGPLSLSVVWR